MFLAIHEDQAGSTSVLLQGSYEDCHAAIDTDSRYDKAAAHAVKIIRGFIKGAGGEGE